MKKIFVLNLFFFVLLSAFAQHKNKVQVTGMIYDAVTKEPVRFVTIIVNRSLGTTSDMIGRFSFIAKKNDTVLFSSVGYKKQDYVIPDTFDLRLIELEVFMLPDTISIGEVEIYPWATYEDFKIAFINLKLPDDGMANAQKNIALIKTQILTDISPDPDISFHNAMQQYYEKSFNQGILYPSNSLLNPIAWAKFFQAIKNGDFKSKK